MIQFPEQALRTWFSVHVSNCVRWNGDTFCRASFGIDIVPELLKNEVDG